MSFFCLFGFVTFFVSLMQFIRMLFADGDLVLMFAERFGKPIASLKGQVVWITGASSGIGECLAYELAKVGAKLILSARREAELERVKKECLVRGPVSEKDILVLPFDITDMKAHQPALDKVMEHFQRVDVLVNNAGTSQRADWEKITLDVDREMFELNVFSVINLTRTIIPQMRKQGTGHLVCMSSVAGKVGAPFSGTYTGTKHALQGYFSSFTAEKADWSIDVTMICPGPVFSNILQAAYTDQVTRLGKDMNPKERRMTSERCAHLSAIAIANRLSEAWVSLQPVLFAMYFNQYVPWLVTRMLKLVGSKMVSKVREGEM